MVRNYCENVEWTQHRTWTMEAPVSMALELIDTGFWPPTFGLVWVSKWEHMVGLDCEMI